MAANYFKFVLLACLASLLIRPSFSPAEEIDLSLRYQTETAEGTGRFHQLHRVESWKPEETAVIVCDVWDLHHSLNAVRRVEELGPRLNDFVKQARNQGMTIIHAPSDCMAAYEKHPARLRASAAPKAENLPVDITSWCSKLPIEEQAVYPLDQSDGGDDDDPAEHAAWAKKLADMGRKPGTPWLKQSDLIEIDLERDFISDKGDEVWNVLTQQGIKNVILTGVHTNMCVLGRPFGLRQLSSNGKNVVLVRDLTDTMYNPARWPYVSHFTGTDLIVSHIERYICPTITSSQLLGGKPLRFKNDTRPHLVMLIAEDEYETDQTLPEFAANYLGKQFRVSKVYDRKANIHDMPGLEVLEDADALLISVRRRPLPSEQLQRIKKCVESGKPVLGIRTASHAFSTRRGLETADLQEWPELDAQVFGGNYTTHHGNKLICTVKTNAANAKHPILTGIKDKPFKAGGSLYKTSPLAKGTTVLMTGSVHAQPEEPVAWTFERKGGGKSFYTSLGHKEDFENPVFIRLLYNALCWATGAPIPETLESSLQSSSTGSHWHLVKMPAPLPKSFESGEVFWCRCGLRITDAWLGDATLQIAVPQMSDPKIKITTWLNGQELTAANNDKGTIKYFDVPHQWIERNDVNLLVQRWDLVLNPQPSQQSLPACAALAGEKRMVLKGTWQARYGNDDAWSNIPLPARYGIGADIIFEPGAENSGG